MYHHAVFFLTAAALLHSANLPRVEGNSPASGDHEEILSKVDTCLNIASKVLETSRCGVRNDFKETQENPSAVVPINSCGCKDNNMVAKPVDCFDLYQDGYRRDGPYEIWPIGNSNESLLVYCDMKGGGWTVLQRRGNFRNPEDYFYRDWSDYKTGFGHIRKEFWIGNDNIFRLTNQRPYRVKFCLTDWTGRYAETTFKSFWIEDESLGYELHIGDIEYDYTSSGSGSPESAGDAMYNHKGKMFSTKDKDNRADGNGTSCAVTYKGAWWFLDQYGDCYSSHLNGPYLKGQLETPGGINWAGYWSNSYSLKDTIIKIRPL